VSRAGGAGATARDLGLVVGASLLVYALLGLDGILRRDPGLYLYAGQRLADGVPPYRSIFDVKTPLTSFVAAAGVATGRALGIDELRAARAAFVPFGAGANAALYLLGRRLLRDRWGGLFAAFLCLPLWGLAVQTVAGPQPKLLVFCFAVLFLLAAVERRWLAAGVAGGLAVLTWQPAGLLLLAGALLALLARSPPALLRLALGVALPVAPMLGYFALAGALGPFLDGVLWVHVLGYYEPGVAPTRVAYRVVRALEGGFSGMGPVLVVGLAACAIESAARTVRSRRRAAPGADGPSDLRARAPGDRDWWPVALVLFPFLAFTGFDFQRYPDLFPLLPFAALGFARLASLGQRATGRALGERARLAAGALLVAGLAAWGVVETRSPRIRSWAPQRETARRLLAGLPVNARVLALDAPAFPVLAGLVQPTRHLVLNRHTVDYIDRTEPGGFDGWIEQLDALDPALVVMGRPKGEHVERLSAWLERDWEPYGDHLGRWTFWVRPDAAWAHPVRRRAADLRDAP
jgi:hypothetical protein